MKVDLKKEGKDLGQRFIRLLTVVGITVVSLCQLAVQIALVFFTFWSVVFILGHRFGQKWERRCTQNRPLPKLLTQPTLEGGSHAK